MRTVIYVDAFNLYYGAVKDTPYKWLDLHALSCALLRPENTITGIKYFTAKVADLFFRLDKVERIGMGIRNMKKAMVAAGLREPIFAPDSFFRATFHHSPEFAMKGQASGPEKKVGEEFGDSSEKTLAFLALHGTASACEVAQALGLTSRAVEKQIATLKATGRLRRVGPDKGGHWEVKIDSGRGEG